MSQGPVLGQPVGLEAETRQQRVAVHVEEDFVLHRSAAGPPGSRTMQDVADRVVRLLVDALLEPQCVDIARTGTTIIVRLRGQTRRRRERDRLHRGNAIADLQCQLHEVVRLPDRFFRRGHAAPRPSSPAERCFRIRSRVFSIPTVTSYGHSEHQQQQQQQQFP